MQTNIAELARKVEALNKHLAFAKQSVEEGWNARDQRVRALNMQAAIMTLDNVVRENEFLTDELYALCKTVKKAVKVE